MVDEKDCLFCKIIREEVSSRKVYEDKDFIAFLDIHPTNEGHTLLIPKKHVEKIYDEGTFKGLGKALQEVSKGVRKAMKCDGLTILQSNEKAAGQVIFHVHFHVIPRFEGDGITEPLKRKQSTEDELDITAGKIRAAVVQPG